MNGYYGDSLVKRLRVSYDGAAMRAPILGLIKANRTERIAGIARQTASVTHAHPLTIELGAVLRFFSFEISEVPTGAGQEPSGADACR